MSASAPKTPASPTEAGPPKPLLPAKGPVPHASARRGRSRANRPNPLLQRLGQLLAIALCLSLPGAAGIILILLAIFNIRDSGGALLWIWIPMILFVEVIALLCAFGVWREFSGWGSPRDYQR